MNSIKLLNRTDAIFMNFDKYFVKAINMLLYQTLAFTIHGKT